MLMLPMRDGRTNEQTTSEDRATQLLICEPLSLAIVLAALCFNFLFCHTSKIKHLTSNLKPNIKNLTNIFVYSNICQYEYSFVSYSYNFLDMNIFGYSFVSFF